MVTSQNIQLRLVMDRQAELQRAAALQRRWRGSDMTEVDVPDGESRRSVRTMRWPLVARLLAAFSRG